MSSRNREENLIKTIIWGLIIWILLVFIIYLFSGSFKSFYAVGILVIIAILRFIIPDYIILRRDRFKKNNNK